MVDFNLADGGYKFGEFYSSLILAAKAETHQ